MATPKSEESSAPSSTTEKGSGWSPDAKQDCLEQFGLCRTGKSITWGAQSPYQPRNWSAIKKATTASTVLFYEFFTTVIATTGPSAAHFARLDERFSARNEELLLIIFAFSYSVGQAFGSMTVPPFSEAAGRKSSYICSCVVFTAMYFLCGTSYTVLGVFMGRFFSGIASAVPSLVVGGTIEDLYDERERIWLVWLWTCFTVLSQLLGPVYGAYVGQAIGWRWIYYAPTIVTAVLLPVLLLSPETRPSVVLAALVRQVDEAVEDKPQEVDLSVSRTIHRPLRLLVGEPLIIMVTVLGGFAMGILYLFTASMDIVYSSPGLGFSYTASSLPFLGMACGVLLSMLPRLLDLKRYQTAGNNAEPEIKLIGFFLGSPALAIGLWIFAWTVPPAARVHWIFSMLGLALVGFAAMETSYTLQGYIADTYTTYASSALSGAGMVKAIVAACAPLVAKQMYKGLGNNWATTVLAICATIFMVAPVIFIRYGPRLRQKSAFSK